MPRLIDVDAPRKTLVDWLNWYKGPDAVKYVVREVVDILDEAPTIDAEPVRHGRWIRCKGKSNLWYCSECGEKILYNPNKRTYNVIKKPVHEVNKRCRSCGAKMDGGASDG